MTTPFTAMKSNPLGAIEAVEWFMFDDPAPLTLQTNIAICGGAIADYHNWRTRSIDKASDPSTLPEPPSPAMWRVASEVGRRGAHGSREFPSPSDNAL